MVSKDIGVGKGGVLGKKRDEQGFNFYKITTFVLVGLLVIVGGFFALNYYGNVQFAKGADYAEKVIMVGVANSLNEKGYVTLHDGNSSVTLVMAQSVEVGQKQVILEIMNRVEMDGAVKLFSNSTSMVLVEADEIEQASGSSELMGVE